MLQPSRFDIKYRKYDKAILIKENNTILAFIPCTWSTARVESKAKAVDLARWHGDNEGRRKSNNMS